MIQSQMKTPPGFPEIKTLFTEISKAQFDNKYQDQQYIASGVQSQVFKATCEGNFVAIKYFRKLCFTPQFISYIQCELQSLNEIRHQNIVSLIGAYHVVSKISAREFCIVTEYCQSSLQSYQLINGLTDVQKLRICEQMLCGIKVAHEKGIIHRDIKPENILIKDTQSMTVKLADFGCSKQLGQHLYMTNIGSPIYSDLNISLGEYTNKCDIYSAGLVIIYIFCGKHFFTDCSRSQLNQCKRQFSNHKQQSTKKFLQNYDLSPQIKDFLETIAFFTLSDNQEQRYSATELLQLVQNERLNFEKHKLYNNESNSNQKNHQVKVQQSDENNPFKKNSHRLIDDPKKQKGGMNSDELNKVANHEKNLQKEPEIKSNLKTLHKSQILPEPKISNNINKLSDNDQSYESSTIWEDDSTTAFEQVSFIEKINKSSFNCQSPRRNQQQAQQLINRSRISKNSFLSKDSEQFNSSKGINQERLKKFRRNSGNLFISNISQTFKSKSSIDPDQRIYRLQENQKNLTDTQKICCQMIKYQAQCKMINEECEAVKIILTRFINMKVVFETIKKIEQIGMGSVTFIQKECIAYFYHYLFTSKLQHLRKQLSKERKNLQSQFGKISTDSKKSIYEIVIQEIERIFPNLKKYAVDLSKKAHLIRPKLSQSFIYSISDIQCCEKSSQLFKINFQQTLIKTEATKFISDKLNDIKNQDDFKILSELYEMLTQIYL